MRPVRVTTHTPVPREEVYDFLGVMANHEPFMDHMLTDWQYSGPDRGVGSKVRVKAKAGGRTDVIDIETVAAESPSMIREENVGAGGGRIATGTYRFEERPGGGTAIEFEYAWKRAPLSERLAAPLVRAIMRRGMQRGMDRLAEQLATRHEGAVA